jgi:signal transduction histidine kinase
MRRIPVSRPGIFVAGYAMLILIGVVDYVTGFDVDVSIFYLLPIGFVAWRLGRRLGLLFAISGALVWSVADNLLAHHYDLPAFAPLWNTVIKTAFFVLVVVILTALRRALDREHRQKVALAESNQALEQFSYIVSHDLQSPIGQVVSYIDLLRLSSEKTLNEKQRGYLDRMQRSALRMRGLIQSLLTLARVKSGVAPAVRVPLDEVARDVINDLAEPIATTKAEVVLGSLPVVSSSREHMYQLLLNLVSNAIKYRRPETPPRIEVNALVDGGGLLLSVADNGMGFAAEDAARLFRPFERLHPQGKIAGSGIGLTICAQIARRHGGSIEAAGVPGQGATFFVRLPMAMVDGGAERRAVPAAAGS